MDRDPVAGLVDLPQVLHHGDIGPQLLHRLGGEVGVVADDVHPQSRQGLGHPGTDGAHADDADPLPGDLGPAEDLFPFFHRFARLGVLSLEGLDPGGGRAGVAHGEDHAGDGQFLDGVGVAPRGVEDHDPLLGAAVHGDGVDPCAHPDDGLHVGAELHVMEGGGMDQDPIGVLDIVAAGVFIGIKDLEPGGADAVFG